MVIEAVCIRAMISAGNLYPEAAAFPSVILGGGNKAAPHAAAALLLSHYQARDAPKPAVFVDQRNAMEGQEADYSALTLRHKNASAR